MADIIAEVTLPSNGKLYGEGVQYRNQLRAPRLRDKGLGDATKKNKLQAGILDKTLIQPLGMSAYDLHTADFVYLNARQRQLSKGDAPYRIAINCNKCGRRHEIDIKFTELEIKPLTEPLNLTYKTMEDDELELTYITPRMLDDCVDMANDYLEQYKECGMSFEDVKTQELLRLVIKKVNGKIKTVPEMTQFIDNLFTEDIDGIINVLESYDFGLQLVRETVCKDCGKKIRYIVPIG